MQRTRKTIIQTFKESDVFGLCEVIDIFKKKKGEQFELDDVTIEPLPECCVCLETYVNDSHHDDLCSNKHPVCGKCLPKVIETTGKCPMCREVIREVLSPNESSQSSDNDTQEQIHEMIDAINYILDRDHYVTQPTNQFAEHIFQEMLRFELNNIMFG